MTNRLTSTLSAALLFVSIAASAPAFAAFNNTFDGAPNKDQADLVKDGYSCGIVAGFTECTKKGSPTYYCVNGKCQSVMIFKGAKLNTKLNTSGGVLRR